MQDLLSAAQSGDFEEVKALLRVHDFVEEDGWAAFQEVVRGDYSEVVQALLVHIPLRGKSGAMLHLATQGGHGKVVRLLLTHFPALLYSDGMVALHVASREGHSDVAQLLVSLHPDLLLLVDPQGWTGLHWACQEGHLQVAEVLLKQSRAWCGCSDDNPHEKKRRRKRTEETQEAQEACKLVRLLSLGDNDGWTALHVAIEEGHEQIAQLLLSHCPTLARDKDKRGNTYLHAAAENGSAGFLQLLWKMRKRALFRENNRSDTPFHIAVKNDNQEAIDWLQYKLSFDEIANVFLACMKDYTPRVTLLLRELVQNPLLLLLNRDVWSTISGYVGIF